MSFKRSGPGVLVSGAIGAGAGVAVVAGLLALLALPAQTRGDQANREPSAAAATYEQPASNA